MIKNKIFAGIRLRLLASYVDLMILALPITFLLWYSSTSLSISILVQRMFLFLIIFILLFIIINLLHQIFFTHYFGGTIGKLLTGLRVVDENGNKLTLKRSFFRYTVGYQFSGILFGLGFLAITKDPQKQGWHDKAVGSKVIVEKRNWPLALLILLVLIILNLYILYSAFTTAFSGPLPKEFGSLMISFQAKQESQNKTPSDLTPKNSDLDTSTWQTYRNDEFGFEVEYPSSWYLKEVLDSSNQRSPDNIFLSPEKITVNLDSEGPFVPIVISIYYSKDQGLDIDKHIEFAQRQRENLEIKEIALGERVFTKISGILGDNTYLSGKFSSIALHEEKGMIISVLYTEIEGVEPETFDQILSTFRFVE